VPQKVHNCRSKELCKGLTGKEVFQILTEVLEYPEKASMKRRPFVIIIDEFSDITKYNGMDVEKAIRAVVQSH